MLFTSGSTGALKGVRVAHEGVAALLRWAGTAFTPSDLSLVAACTSLSFDPSVLEIFTPLTTGGAIRLLPNALALAGLDPSVEVRSALLPPSALQELVHSGKLPRSLRTIMIGGEPLRAALANRVLAQTGVERLIFAYGPTEGTVMATAHDVTGPTVDPIPIGRPLPDVAIDLLDPAGRPVPEGEIGEIYLTGPQVALGYVGGDPEARAQFGTSAEGGLRRYRTLDLARRRPGGDLEFGGRVDRQVKVRGFRVEPGEVEAVLSRHPGVAQAFVRAVGSSSSSQLVGYTVPLAEAVPASELRAFVRRSLPEYMVPSVFLSLSSFPVNRSGKVDADALPTPPDRLGPSSAAEAVADDDVERTVTGLVRSVLGIDHEVGLDDDFMDDLGGTSLSAFRLLFEIEERFGVAIPMTALLEDATVGGFVRAVQDRPSGQVRQLVHNLRARRGADRPRPRLAVQRHAVPADHPPPRRRAFADRHPRPRPPPRPPGRGRSVPALARPGPRAAPVRASGRSVRPRRSLDRWPHRLRDGPPTDRRPG